MKCPSSAHLARGRPPIQSVGKLQTAGRRSSLRNLPLFWFVPAVLALVLSASAAESLYEKFRPVTSLPWTKPGADEESVLREIYREPKQLARRALLEAYLEKVPASSFPRVFDLCLRLEEDDSPDELLKLLVRVWATKDPAAAWARCEGLFDLIIPENPLGVDTWATGIIVLNPQAAAGSNFWPQSDAFALAFSEGVAQSDLPQAEKDRFTARQEAKSKDWSAAYDAVEKKTPYDGVIRDSSKEPPPAPPPSKEVREMLEDLDTERKAKDLHEQALREFLLEILACPPTEIQAKLRASPVEPLDEMVLARAMIRWMDGKPQRGPEIVDFVLRAHDPTGAFREFSTREPIPIEFLLEWALLDRKGFKEWAILEKDQNGNQKGRPGLSRKSFAVLHAFAYRDDSKAWLEDFAYPSGPREEEDEMAMNWARIDPSTALPWIWSRGGYLSFEDAAEDSTNGHSEIGCNVLRAIFATHDDYAVPIPGRALSNMMEEWSDVDAAACARHGVRWNLRTRVFSKERLINLWNGYEDPYDGTVDDRCFGSLRIWAMRKPDEMRKWIHTEPLDNDVREALLWLVENAKGGGGIRAKDSTPRKP